jgi:hypothetical protein
MEKWYKNINKQEAYDNVQSFAEQNGMHALNTSTVTLLFPPGDFCSEEEVKAKVLKFLKGTNSPAIISIEPVMTSRNQPLPELYRMAGMKNFDLLPLYHVHIMMKEEGFEVRSQRHKWSKIVGSRSRNLFQCKYIETSIKQTTNYITKFFEEKNGKSGIIGFYVPAPATKSEETHAEVLDEMVMEHESEISFPRAFAKILKIVKSVILNLLFYDVESRAKIETYPNQEFVENSS